MVRKLTHMSFQRILELARRQGAPLIVTDPAGRESMVVLPFDAYEALVEGVEAPVRSSASVPPPVPEPELVVSPSSESEPVAEAEMSLEERFSIEPIEDYKNMA